MTSKFYLQSREWKLSEKLIDTLCKNEITEYFPVQESIIPLLIRLNSFGCVQPRDLCVSAPTGSGKTLAYAIPIVQLLSKTISTDKRLRALIVLPSRELATQVYGVFAKLVIDTKLIIFHSTSEMNLSEEQQLLMGPCKKRKLGYDSDCYFDNSSLYYYYHHHHNYSSNYDYSDSKNNGRCNVDILISTPSRLLDHIHKTKGFSLESLRFLILDEADRLLGNAYNYWVKSLIDSTSSSSSSSSSNVNIFNRPSIQRLLFSATLTDNPRKLGFLGIRNPMIIKIGSLSSTNIHQEINEDKEEKDQQYIEDENQEIDEENKTISLSSSSSPTLTFTLPTKLTESIKICDTEERPIHLIAILLEAFKEIPEEIVIYNPKLSFIKAPLVQSCDGNVCMIFASSVESTHRLCTLLQLFNGQTINKDNKREENNHDDDNGNNSNLKFGGRVEEISRMVKASSRAKVLSDASLGFVRIIVASDNMARGIDLINVKLVINYDPPKFLKTYVHRAGRTARANRSGHCLTLLKKGQVGIFRKMRAEIGDIPQSDLKSRPPKYKIHKDLLESINPIYQKALKQLQQQLLSS